MAATFTTYSDPQPGALVERFSFEVERRGRTEDDTDEYDQLRGDLIVETRRRKEAREQDTGSHAMHSIMDKSIYATLLEQARQQLYQTMKEFQNLVPSHLKKDELPANWDEILLVTTEIQRQWKSKAEESRVGRAKEWIRRMLNGMNNHATALKMLPSESEYVSLFAGSVSMIMKASANHIEISESFARGIVDINDAVNLEHLSRAQCTPVLQELTMRLYTHIFAYLTHYMTWFTERSRKRFLHSFNETKPRLIQDILGQIKLVSDMMSKHYQISMAATIEASKHLIESFDAQLQNLLSLSEARETSSQLREAANMEAIQNQFRHQMEMDKEERRCVLVKINKAIADVSELERSTASGAAIICILTEQVSHERTILSHREDSHELQLGLDTEPNAEQHPRLCSGSYIAFASRHLEEYFTWDSIHTGTESLPPLFADPEFVGRLSSFTTVLKSTILYAHGQHQTKFRSLLHQSALAYVFLARNAGAPVISYFCELSHCEPPENRTRESVALSALLNAMIRQIVNILPTEPTTAAAFPEPSRFRTLDGTLRTWEEAISLFEDLVRCVNLPILVFVIDGINVLEDDLGDVTAKPLQSLISCLGKLAKPSALGEDNIVKVLFTSSGLSETLCRVLDHEDMIFCDNSSSGVAGGAYRARQVISF